MSRLIAALDNSAAAHPTLDVAVALGRILDAEVDAVHVVDSDATTARSVADGRHVPFRDLTGPTAEALAAAIEPTEVMALVVGARRAPGGARPAGHITLELLARATKPIVVVPPNCTRTDLHRGDRILLPLDGSATAARAVGPIAALGAAHGLDVVVLHVFDVENVPRFWDHPEHDEAPWGREFLDRFCPGPGVSIELRAGDAGRTALDVGHECDVGLIAVGWPRDLAPARAHTVKELLSDSPVPVILVPTAARPPTHGL